MRTILIAGNWKMHTNADSAKALASSIIAPGTASVEVLLIPPAVYFNEVAAASHADLKLGAQNLAEQENGAFTGEISGEMLKDCGCSYVLVGHSERRAYFHDSAIRVAAKFQRALEAGLTPVLCVGETLEQRESAQTETVVMAQIDAVIQRCGFAAFTNAVLSYEPVWAIGTGKTASPEQAQAVHAFIRGHLSKHDVTIANGLRILYGGSVKASNARALLDQPDIDGALIGGASLVGTEFNAIIQSASDLVTSQA